MHWRSKWRTNPTPLRWLLALSLIAAFVEGFIAGRGGQ